MIADVSTPQHGGQLRKIAERFGVPLVSLLDFSANINPEGPSSFAMDALHQALKDPATLTAYPDLEETQLRNAISASINVPPEEIAVANGFVPLLNAALTVFPIRRCLMPVPAFGEYRSALERAGVEVAPYFLDQAKDFRYQPDKLLTELVTGHHDCILFANPQNPSAVLLDGSVLVKFLEDAARLDVCILLDEAFIDYAPAHSMVKEMERFAKLVVFRSVTKFHGCPGLRVAYAVARNTIIRKMQQALAPWAITTLAKVGVQASLTDAAYKKRTLRLNGQRREHLLMGLEALELRTYPSDANFVLIRFPSSAEAVSCRDRLIRDYGVVLRDCGSFEGLTTDHLRCAILDDERNARLLFALAQICGH